MNMPSAEVLKMFIDAESQEKTKLLCSIYDINPEKIDRILPLEKLGLRILDGQGMIRSIERIFKTEPFAWAKDGEEAKTEEFVELWYDDGSINRFATLIHHVKFPASLTPPSLERAMHIFLTVRRWSSFAEQQSQNMI